MCVYVCFQVESVAGLRHPHVVTLYGYCMEVPDGTEMTEQVLVFECMPNGDMTKLLENRECRNSQPVSLQNQGEGESLRCFHYHAVFSFSPIKRFLPS